MIVTLKIFIKIKLKAETFIFLFIYYLFLFFRGGGLFEVSSHQCQLSWSFPFKNRRYGKHFQPVTRFSLIDIGLWVWHGYVPNVQSISDVKPLFNINNFLNDLTAQLFEKK